MRDIERIDLFCSEFAKIWKANCPEWRFGQLVSNIQRSMQNDKRDMFFPEEKAMIDYMKKYFGLDNNNLSITTVAAATNITDKNEDLIDSLYDCVMEECAEIIQAITKSLRFGFDNINPQSQERQTNEEHLLEEYYQLISVIELLQLNKGLKQLTDLEIEKIKLKKQDKVIKYYYEITAKLNKDSRRM